MKTIFLVLLLSSISNAQGIFILDEIKSDVYVATSLPKITILPITLYVPTVNAQDSISNAIVIQMHPQRHSIRNGRLLEYRCPGNGQRCRWIDRGPVLKREVRDGAVWVTILGS